MIVKDSNNFLLVVKNDARRGVLALGSNERTFLGAREVRCWAILD
jgi:hypothetical protein